MLKFDQYNGRVAMVSNYDLKHNDKECADNLEDLVIDFNSLARVYNALVQAVMSSRND